MNYRTRIVYAHTSYGRNAQEGVLSFVCVRTVSEWHHQASWWLRSSTNRKLIYQSDFGRGVQWVKTSYRTTNSCIWSKDSQDGQWTFGPIWLKDSKDVGQESKTEYDMVGAVMEMSLITFKFQSCVFCDFFLSRDNTSIRTLCSLLEIDVLLS